MATLRRASNYREPEPTVPAGQRLSQNQGQDRPGSSRKSTMNRSRAPSTDAGQRSVRKSTVDSSGRPERRSVMHRYSMSMSPSDTGRFGRRMPGMEWDDLGHKKAPVAMLPSYRLCPEPAEKFNWCAARNIITGILDGYLSSEKYERNMCSNFAKTLSEMIKERVKEQKFSKRYKYVCYVTLGQKSQDCRPSIVCCSRCVWDRENDNYASVTFAKGDLFAVATIFASYYE